MCPWFDSRWHHSLIQYQAFFIYLGMTLLITYLLIALLFSFICSILEAVILSITPSYIAVAIQEKRSYATRLHRYKENIDKPLAAILTLNTFAHTIGAAGVGAQAQMIWGNESLSITSAVLTIIILIFSEIIPKTIGANYWKRLVPASLVFIRFFLFVLYPFVFLSQLVTKFLNKENVSVLSRKEFSAMAEAGAKAGVIRRGESKIIQNIARFDQIQTRDIMTPRTVIYAADQNFQIKDFYKYNPESRYSRILLYDGDMDNITGFFLKDELLISMIENDGEGLLKDLLRKIEAVYLSLPIPMLYQNLMEKKEHIALVVDEYGGTAGVVTLEDVLETIIGMEIVDETDDIEDLRIEARRRWEERRKRVVISDKRISD